MAKQAKKTLRSEVAAARKAVEGLLRLKATVPMVETQRDAIDAALVSLRFAWRNHKLESKVGDRLTLDEYFSRIRTELPKTSWRLVGAGKPAVVATKKRR